MVFYSADVAFRLVQSLGPPAVVLEASAVTSKDGKVGLASIIWI